MTAAHSGDLAPRSPLESLDRLLHQPVRLRIVWYLYEHGETEFSTLCDDLSLTPGNLRCHTDRLAEADCLIREKTIGENRPRTRYWLTPTGIERFESHQRTLGAIAATRHGRCRSPAVHHQ
ncbi:transcriptional regulator [Halalkalirubrum salinum]|uniref:transcriptional regulator n=1 Tax=Halalkalirubrum salinum TaxID=2563889 RepID=UPI0010FB70F8|nr:transcriptional regulator [Halalkalirubrum salinum]